MTRSTQQVVDEWHRIVDESDAGALRGVLAEDCVFRSPVVHTPQRGRTISAMYLASAMQVFEGSGFRYVAETVDERRAVLEFACELDGTHVNGVDLVDVVDGEIVRFTVMVRPLQGIQELHRRMGAVLAAAQASRDS